MEKEEKPAVAATARGIRRIPHDAIIGFHVVSVTPSFPDAEFPGGKIY
jgi:hypothetical protein